MINQKKILKFINPSPNIFIRKDFSRISGIYDPAYLLSCFYVAALPFIKLAPAIILMTWIIISVFSYRWTKVIKVWLRNKTNWFLTLLYILVVINIFFTSDMDGLLSKIQLKSSYLLLPFLIAPAAGFNKIKLYNILKVFIFFITISIFVNLISSMSSFMINKNTEMFFYNHISLFHHTSYYALYIAFSAMALLFLQRRKVINNLFVVSVLIALHLGIIFLISSKAGILVIFLLLIIESFLRLFENTNVKHLLIFIGSLAIVVISISLNYRMTNALNNFKNNNAESNNTGSTNSRIQVWKTSLEIIPENWVLGVGPADADDVLVERYKVKKYTVPAEKRLNCHNQFLQTQLSLGVFGILFLILSFISIFLHSKSNFKRLMLMFLIMVFMNFLFEAMLETQSGVQFTIFFLTLFSYLKYKPQTYDTFLSPQN